MIKTLAQLDQHSEELLEPDVDLFLVQKCRAHRKTAPDGRRLFPPERPQDPPPGFAVDSLPVHLWKRAERDTALLITWAKFLKEMEEVWLQTRKKSETEERWLEQIQKIQTDIWQALKIGEIQNLYTSAKGSLPERAGALLEQLEDLSSRVVYNRSDLNRFLKQWEHLRLKIQELRPCESEAARRVLDEIHSIQAGIRLGDRIQEWQDAYTRLRGHLPSKAQLSLIKFDVHQQPNRLLAPGIAAHLVADPVGSAPVEALADPPVEIRQSDGQRLFFDNFLREQFSRIFQIAGH